MSPGKSSGDVIFDTLFPPSSAAEKMDIEALSGICGSISIACWVVVFSPQIIENFRRHSADGISLLFLAIWLLGDVFNILGAVMQRVLPTMIILAVYYTLADIVLLAQCLYYRGLWPWLFGARKGEHAHDSQPDIITTTNNAATMNPSHASGGGSSSNVDRPATADSASSTSASEPFDASLERSPLLQQYSATATAGSGSNEDDLRQRRRRSFRERLSFANGEHLSPTVPMVEPPRDDEEELPHHRRRAPPTALQKVVFNFFAIALVCAAGWLGWYISSGSKPGRRTDLPLPGPGGDDDGNGNGSPGGRNGRDELQLDPLGQTFGYFCTALYLGSRVPQLLLNYHRKSTEGISLLFFLFACIGNLTFVLSIAAYSPVCDAQLQRRLSPNPTQPNDDAPACRPGEKYELYMRYMLVNAPWLLGSLGNLMQDMFIFVQFVLYRNNNAADGANGASSGAGAGSAAPARRGSEHAVSDSEA